MSTSFSLSLELIFLMNWLLKNNKIKLKNLISEAIKQGLLEELELIDENEENLNDTTFLHNTILDFLLFLEDSLLETLEQKNINFDLKEKFKSTLQKINSQSMDRKTIWLSMNQTKIKNKSNNDEVKNALLNQLIKNWKPKDNEPIN
ncbi:hypothetical protein ACFLYH_02685 [Candidatus Dependentiae bacterium]